MNVVIATSSPGTASDAVIPILRGAGLATLVEIGSLDDPEIIAGTTADGDQSGLDQGSPGPSPAAGELGGDGKLLFVDGCNLALLDRCLAAVPHAPVLLFFSRAEQAFAGVLARDPDTDPQAFLADWVRANRGLLQFQRRNRGRAVFLNLTVAARYPLGLIQALQDRGLALRAPGEAIGSTAAPMALEQLLARELIPQGGGIEQIEAELEASALPLGETQDAWPGPGALLEGYRGLRSHGTARRDLAQENDLLAAHLGQVQAERLGLDALLEQARAEAQSAESARRDLAQENDLLAAHLGQVQAERLGLDAQLDQARAEAQSAESARRDLAQENDLLAAHLGQVQAERLGLDAQLDQARAEAQSAESARRDLAQENDLLAAHLGQLQAERLELDALLEQARAEAQSAESARRDLAQENDLLAAHLGQLQAEVEHYATSTRDAMARLASSDRAVSDLKRRIADIQASITWKATAPLRVLAAGRQGDVARGRNAWKRQVKLIEQSGLFDRQWYLSAYGDVRRAGMDPIRHYLKFGAAEGRNPSARFDTRFYLETYPDVVESGLNPLLHYVQLGREEGRKTLRDAG